MIRKSWVGVETWILANGGSLDQAFRTFYETAFEGEFPISLVEFQKRYPIIDPGVNVKNMRHDNFVRRISEQAYQGMCAMVSAYMKGELRVE